MSANLRNFAGVANAYARRPRRRGLRHERPQPLRKRHIWPPSAILIRRQRRQVHSITNHAFRKVIANLHRHLRPDFFLRLGRRPRNVRGGDHVRQTRKGRILGRLFDKNVQGRTSQLAAFQRLSQCGFIDQLAARRIHQSGARLHLRQSLRID